MAILKVDTISGIGTEGPVFEGDIEFTSQNFLTLPKGDTTQRGRGRALFLGGLREPSPSSINNISYSQIQSTGTVIDFGDLTLDRWISASGASSTRAVIAGGYSAPDRRNTIDFVTIATTSNAIDFGHLITQRTYVAGFSNSTRSIAGGGNDGSDILNSIEFLTIASTGE